MMSQEESERSSYCHRPSHAKVDHRDTRRDRYSPLGRLLGRGAAGFKFSQLSLELFCALHPGERRLEVIVGQLEERGAACTLLADLVLHPPQRGNRRRAGSLVDSLAGPSASTGSPILGQEEGLFPI